MFIIILLLALVFSGASCTLQKSIPVVDNFTNYTQIIGKWVDNRHPHESFTLKVHIVKPVIGERGQTEVLAVQVHIFYKTSAESYILFFRHGKIMSWIEAGEPQEEEEEVPEEVFLGKDAA